MLLPGACSGWLWRVGADIEPNQTHFALWQAVVASRTLMALAVTHGGFYEAPGKRWYVVGIEAGEGRGVCVDSFDPIWAAHRSVGAGRPSTCHGRYGSPGEQFLRALSPRKAACAFTTF